MAETTAVDLIKSAGEILHDDTYVRWTQVELLGWLNAAQKAIVLQRPDAFVVNEAFACAPDSSKQELPDNGLRLIEVVRNTADDSLGEAIVVVDRDVMDATVPGWHRSGAVQDIENYVFDERDPTHFYLYPVPEDGAQIEIIYSKAPDDIEITDFATDTQTIDIDDSYVNVILDYMLYRAYSKDTEYAKNSIQSLNHYNDYANALGMKMKADVITSPNEQA